MEDVLAAARDGKYHQFLVRQMRAAQNRGDDDAMLSLLLDVYKMLDLGDGNDKLAMRREYAEMCLVVVDDRNFEQDTKQAATGILICMWSTIDDRAFPRDPLALFSLSVLRDPTAELDVDLLKRASHEMQYIFRIRASLPLAMVRSFVFVYGLHRKHHLRTPNTVMVDLDRTILVHMAYPNSGDGFLVRAALTLSSDASKLP